MNSYGTQAMGHWARHLPLHYATLTDPAAFFTFLGAKAAREVEARAGQLAGAAPPGEITWDRRRRLMLARRMAEQAILPGLVRPQPQHTRRDGDPVCRLIADLLREAAQASNGEAQ